MAFSKQPLFGCDELDRCLLTQGQGVFSLRAAHHVADVRYDTSSTLPVIATTSFKHHCIFFGSILLGYLNYMSKEQAI